MNTKRVFAYINKFRKSLGFSRQRDYRKFIILSRSRTGSNLLLSYLNNHPNIVANHEIFQRPSKKGYEKILNKQFKMYPKSIKAVGFKIFYNHPLGEENNELWSELVNMKELYVLHLKRKNILRTLISLKLALVSDTWVKYSSEHSKKKSVTFTKSELMEGFIQTKNWEMRGEEMFNDHPLLTIWYEELISESVETFNNITDFLNLEPSEVNTYLKKQNPEKSRNLISNYDELINGFLGTPWESFFYD
jgi:LPS sulfotransferase NodH